MPMPEFSAFQDGRMVSRKFRIFRMRVLHPSQLDPFTGTHFIPLEIVDNPALKYGIRISPNLAKVYHPELSDGAVMKLFIVNNTLDRRDYYPLIAPAIVDNKMSDGLVKVSRNTLSTLFDDNLRNNDPDDDPSAIYLKLDQHQCKYVLFP
jgi:hypothetical protein